MKIEVNVIVQVGKLLPKYCFMVSLIFFFFLPLLFLLHPHFLLSPSSYSLTYLEEYKKVLGEKKEKEEGSCIVKIYMYMSDF